MEAGTATCLAPQTPSRAEASPFETAEVLEEELRSLHPYERAVVQGEAPCSPHPREMAVVPAVAQSHPGDATGVVQPGEHTPRSVAVKAADPRVAHIRPAVLPVEDQKAAHTRPAVSDLAAAQPEARTRPAVAAAGTAEVPTVEHSPSPGPGATAGGRMAAQTRFRQPYHPAGTAAAAAFSPARSS